MKDLLNQQLNLKLLAIIALILMAIVGVIILGYTLMSSQAPSKINADSVSVYLSPETTTLSSTQDTELVLYINTGGNEISGIDVFLKYDPTILSMSPVQGESFQVFQANKSGGVYELQAGGDAAASNTTSGTAPFKGTGIIARLKVKALSNVANAQISITSDSKLIDTSSNVITFSTQSIKTYTYSLQTVTQTTPISVNLSPSTANITQTDSTIDVNIDTLNQSVQAIRLNIQYDPTQVSVTADKGIITTFNSGIFSASNVGTNIFRLDMATDVNNKNGFNGSGTIARLKVHALSSNASSTNLTLLPSSEFTVDSVVWSTIAASSAKTYSYQLNPISSSSSKSSVSSKTASSKIATTKSSSTGTMPNTGIFDDGQGILIMIFVILSIIGVASVYKYTKFGSFERKFIK